MLYTIILFYKELENLTMKKGKGIFTFLNDIFNYYYYNYYRINF